MDLALVEYALWVMLGLWATLFVDNAIARGAGIVLIILALLRALAERDGRPAKTGPGQAGDPNPSPDHGAETPEAETARPGPRRRIL